jgi:hypothetical protein
MTVSDAGSVTLSSSVFVGNSADYGGAIEIEMRTFTFQDCVFEDNVAAISGGAVATRNRGHVVLENCHVEGNSAPIGGAVAAVSAYITAKDTTFVGNWADNGLDATHATVKLTVASEEDLYHAHSVSTVYVSLLSSVDDPVEVSTASLNAYDKTVTLSIPIDVSEGQITAVRLRAGGSDGE